MKKWLCMIICAVVSEPALAADVPAVLQWSHRVEISVPVSGVVQTVHVETGDLVKKGQILLALDKTSFQAKVAESRAAVSRLDEEVAEAKRNLDRVKELYDRTVIATTELDQAKLRYVQAKAMLAEAQARMKQHQNRLDDAAVRAPFDAVVVARQVESGQTVSAEFQPQTLLVLAKSGEMLARLRVSDTQIDKLKPGQPVTVTVGGKNYSGIIKVLGLEPIKAKEEVAYAVDVAFPTREQLRAGTLAVVKLP